MNLSLWTKPTPYMRMVFPQYDDTYQQGDKRCHTARSVRTSFEDKITVFHRCQLFRFFFTNEKFPTHTGISL